MQTKKDRNSNTNDEIILIIKVMLIIQIMLINNLTNRNKSIKS